MIKKCNNKFFVEELKTGFVVLGDYQYFRGYTLFLCKKHVTELHFMSNDFKIKHLKEMSIVAEAVFKAFKPQKINYELLGNVDAHVHWHIFPRVTNDTPQKGPVWWVPQKTIENKYYKLSEAQMDEMKFKLRDEIKKLI